MTEDGGYGLFLIVMAAICFIAGFAAATVVDAALTAENYIRDFVAWAIRQAN